MNSFLSVVTLREQYEIQFKRPVPPELCCSICTNVLFDAQQTSCGCKSCRKCIEGYLGNTEKLCPICKEAKLQPSVDIFPDNATNKEIIQLEVFCPFKCCGFIDLLVNIDRHIDQCEFRETRCDKCQQKILWSEKDRHDLSNCDMRLVSCERCGQQMTQRELTGRHWDVNGDDLCETFIGLCPNNCGINQEVVLKTHLSICPNRTFKCPFRELSCTDKSMTSSQFAKHCKKRALSHNRLVIESVTKINQKLDLITDEVEKLEQLNDELVNIDEKCQLSFEKNVAIVNGLVNQKTSERVIAPDTTIIFRSGNFIWKITDFESKRLEDCITDQSNPIYSDPFYTNEFGYKLRLKIYPDGFRNGKSKSLSVYLVLMKGEFDNLLSWPFRRQVEISLRDQQTLTNHHLMTFTPNPEDLCLTKPTDDHSNIFGFDTFISLSDIIPSSIFYKNNTVFVKISVL